MREQVLLVLCGKRFRVLLLVMLLSELRQAYPMVTPISFPLHFVGISFDMCIHSPDDVFISKCVN